MPRRFVHGLLVLGLLPVLSAFTCGTNPCDQDRFGCNDPGEGLFDYLPSCPALEPLEVELGVGEAGFIPLAEGKPAPIYRGPQGGQHTFFALRVKNPRLDLYSQLRVHLWLAQGSDCDAPAEPTGEPPETCSELGMRDLVLGTSDARLSTNSGVVEESKLLVFVSSPTSAQKTLMAVEVEDPCRRFAGAYHTFTMP